MTTAGLKVWLETYRDQVREIEHMQELFDTLDSKATSPGTPTLDGLPRSPGYAVDRMGGIVSELDELRAEIADLQAKATETRHEIQDAIKQITGPNWPDRRAVLRFRYLLCLEWADVTNALFGSEPDYLSKEDSYLRRTFLLHRDALQMLAGIVGSEKQQK